MTEAVRPKAQGISIIAGRRQRLAATTAEASSCWSGRSAACWSSQAKPSQADRLAAVDVPSHIDGVDPCECPLDRLFVAQAPSALTQLRRAECGFLRRAPSEEPERVGRVRSQRSNGARAATTLPDRSGPLRAVPPVRSSSVRGQAQLAPHGSPVRSRSANSHRRSRDGRLSAGAAR